MLFQPWCLVTESVCGSVHALRLQIVLFFPDYCGIKFSTNTNSQTAFLRPADSGDIPSCYHVQQAELYNLPRVTQEQWEQDFGAHSAHPGCGMAPWHARREDGLFRDEVFQRLLNMKSQNLGGWWFVPVGSLASWGLGKVMLRQNVPFQKENPDLVVRNLQVCHIHHWKWLNLPSLLLAWWVCNLPAVFISTPTPNSKKTLQTLLLNNCSVLTGKQWSSINSALWSASDPLMETCRGKTLLFCNLQRLIRVMKTEKPHHWGGLQPHAFSTQDLRNELMAAAFHLEGFFPLFWKKCNHYQVF